MQFILILLTTLTLGFSLLQCEKTKVANNSKSNNQTTTAGNNPNVKTRENTTAASTPQNPPSDNAPRISLADAKKDFDAGNVVFVDTRAESSYKQEHIKGAINVSMETVEMRYKELPKGKKIIAYCS